MDTVQPQEQKSEATTQQALVEEATTEQTQIAASNASENNGSIKVESTSTTSQQISEIAETKASEFCGNDDDINHEETAKLERDVIFQRFLQWCDSNGLKRHPNLQVPAAFGSLGIPGIAAAERLESNTVIAAIPNNLLITLRKIKDSELRPMFKEKANGDLYNEDKAGDAEFNIIAAYLIREKLKGEDSFYKPYFDTIVRSFTMYDWSLDEVAATECPELIDEFSHYVEDMEVTWRDLRACLVKYPNFYKESDLTKEIFLWAYELIMTRIFGYSLPCTCLVPFGDLFNHGNHSSTHYIVNKRFEEEVSISHEHYKIKKDKIDLSIFRDSGKTEPAAKEGAYPFRSKRLNFVKKHYRVLPKHVREAYEWDSVKYIEDNALRNMVYEINAYELAHNKEANIWDLKFYTTSATEDNDTDEDQTEGRKKEYQSLYERELQTVEDEAKRLKESAVKSQEGFAMDNKIDLGIRSVPLEEVKKEELRQKKLGEAENRNAADGNEADEDDDESDESGFESNSQYDEADDEEEDEEDEDEEEQEEEEKDAVGESKDKGNDEQEDEEEEKKTDENNNNSNKMTQNKENLSEKKTNGNKSPKGKEEKKESSEEDEEKGSDDDSQSSLSDDSKWDWYDNENKDMYFAVTTEQPVEKGKQIFLCYGRRTNKFLLQWYGFAFNDNLFDSFGFRMWIKPDPHALVKNIEDQIVFRKYISEDDWRKGKIEFKGQSIDTKELTKEFRLKRGIICNEFIVYLRIYLSNHYTKMDVSKILFTLPYSLDFEIFAFEFALRVFIYMRSSYSTTEEEDTEQLKDLSLPYRKRFALVLRRDHKRILQEQIEIVQSVLSILRQLQESQFNLASVSSSSSSTTISKATTESSQLSESTSTITTQSESPIVILSEKHTNDLKSTYMLDFEDNGDLRRLVQQRHKIKNYLKQLYLGIYKKFIM